MPFFVALYCLVIFARGVVAHPKEKLFVISVCIMYAVLFFIVVSIVVLIMLFFYVSIVVLLFCSTLTVSFIVSVFVISGQINKMCKVGLVIAMCSSLTES